MAPRVLKQWACHDGSHSNIYSFKRMEPFMSHTLGRHKIWPWELRLRTPPNWVWQKCRKDQRLIYSQQLLPLVTWYSGWSCFLHFLGLDYINYSLLIILINYKRIESKWLTQKRGFIGSLRKKAQQLSHRKARGTMNPFLSHLFSPSHKSFSR